MSFYSFAYSVQPLFIKVEINVHVRIPRDTYLALFLTRAVNLRWEKHLLNTVTYGEGKIITITIITAIVIIATIC